MKKILIALNSICVVCFCLSSAVNFMKKNKSQGIIKLILCLMWVFITAMDIKRFENEAENEG